MFVHFILLVVCLVTFQRSFHVSGCDHNCADKPEFSASSLVVKYGDPASVNCSVCENCQSNIGLEIPVGKREINGTLIQWTVDNLTEWGLSAMCYHTAEGGHQCCSTLPVTLYKLPDTVSISFVNHTGRMLAGHQYTLKCSVQDVAPVENLTVTFYSGQRQLGQKESNSKGIKPESETFELDFSPTKEDDGGQLWCEAELLLGPDGPQPPPVVKSQHITATVHYKPQLIESSLPDPITVTAGEPLQLNCSAVGNPEPKYIWINSSHNMSSSVESVFMIKSVTPADDGQYACIVHNDVGSTIVLFNVTVTGLEFYPTTVENPTTVANPTTVTSTTTVTSPTTVTSSTTVTTTTARNKSSSSLLIHRITWCFMLLVSVLV